MFDVFTKVREASAAGVKQLAPQRSFRSSRSLRLALLATLAGMAMWIMRSGTTDEASQAKYSGAPSPETAQTSSSRDPRASSKDRGLIPTSPALFRFGASFLGGFFVGFALRRFLKVTALLAGLVVGGLGLMKLTGLIELDWAAIESHLRESLAWTKGEVEGFKALLTGYLPSAVAGFLGIFKGLRWK